MHGLRLHDIMCMSASLNLTVLTRQMGYHASTWPFFASREEGWKEGRNTD